MKFQDLDFNLDKELEAEILYNAVKDEIETKNTKKQRKAKKRNNSYQYLDSRLKSGIKIKTVLLLLVTLIVNTYAWFIYISTVSTDISMHVKSWDFRISSGGATENFEFFVDQIYPGMEEAKQEIDAKNNGETDAELTCEINSMTILGAEYKVGETYIENGEEKIYTSDKLFEILNAYPFKVQIYIDDNLFDGTSIEMTTGAETKMSFTVNWDYETGENAEEIEAADEIDTYWGNQAYKFHQDNPNSYSIKLDLTIKAIQTNS